MGKSRMAARELALHADDANKDVRLMGRLLIRIVGVFVV